MKNRHTKNEGAIGSIQHDGRWYYARLLKGLELGVYAKSFEEPLAPPLLPQLSGIPYAFQVGIHVGVPGKGRFEIIEKPGLTQVDIDAMKPKFWQDIGNPFNCILLYPDGTEKKVTPEECIGLERIGAAEFRHVLWRIDAVFNNKPNPTLDVLKVKLPK